MVKAKNVNFYILGSERALREVKNVIITFYSNFELFFFLKFVSQHNLATKPEQNS